MAKSASEALLYAAESGCLQDVQAALKAGADIDYTQMGCEITGTGTALFIASAMGYVDIVRLLIRKGASISKRTMGLSSAPLHGAATRGHTEVVELLVHHGATLDIRDVLQRTPLMTACLFKQSDTVRQLIEFGARVDLTDSRGNTAQEYCEMDTGEEPCLCAQHLKMQIQKIQKLLQEAMRTKLLRCCNPTCGKPGYRLALKRCGQCKLTRYCRRDCQKQHWLAGHKKCCGQDACTANGPNFMAFLKTVTLPTGDTLVYLDVPLELKIEPITKET